jgi:hypothetical protein
MKITIITRISLSFLLMGTMFSCSQPQPVKKEKKKPRQEKSVQKQEQVKEEEKKGPSPFWANFFTEGYTSTWKMTFTRISYPDEELPEEVLAENPELGKERTEVSKANVTVRVKSVKEEKPGLWKAVIKTSKPSSLEGVWYTDGRTCWSENFTKKRGVPAFKMTDTPTELMMSNKRIDNDVKHSFQLDKRKNMWKYTEDITAGNPRGFSIYFSEALGVAGYVDYLENHWNTEKTEMWLVK